MRLDMNISDKDKRLLMLIGIAAVLVLTVRFLILPSIERGQELEATIDEADAVRGERRIRLHELEYLDDAIARQQAELDLASAPFYPPMATREMDDLVTGLLLQHGLFPEKLSLTEAEPGITAPYPFRTADAETVEAESFLELTPDYLLLATAQLQARGELAQWQAFMDDVVQNYPGLRVTRFEARMQSFVTEELETVVTHEFDCGLEIYMCRKEAAP